MAVRKKEEEVFPNAAGIDVGASSSAADVALLERLGMTRSAPEVLS